MGREGFQVSSTSKSRFQAYGYNNEKDKDDVYDTPIARRGNGNGSSARRNIPDCSDEDENIDTPLHSKITPTSSGWLEKTSHQSLPEIKLMKKNSSASNKMKKKSKIIHDSDESDVEIFSVNEDSPKDNSFKDIAPTVIYQLHEDNISKLMEDRENGIYPVQRKKGLEKETGRGKLQGCSLGHMQQKSTNGRLLKKRMRSLSLTDSDVESVKDEMIMTHPLSRSDSAENLVPKGHELIVLESDDEIPPTRKNGAGNLKSQPIAVGESEEEEEGSVDEDGSFQSEASDDEGSDRQLESESDDGGKWYGSGSEESEDGGRRSRRRGSDDEKTEIELRIEMERKCRRILQRCADVSKLLRQALISWSQDTSSSSHIGTCVNLISMGGQNSNIISQDLIIQNISPQLVLKDYQLVGLNWLKLMHTNDVNGVLADDMGLGKTVQTIGFVGWLHFDRQSRKKIPQTHLIVVPASTLTNWTKEFSRFCPHLKVVRFHGTVEEKYRIKQKLKRMLLDRSRSKDRIDVVLTTYTQFERESGADDRKFLRKIPFEYLILDEAHCIKNSQSSRYANLRHLNTRRRLLLSGTPVQNDVRELLSLLGFLMPQVFKAEYIEMLLASLKLEHLPDPDSKTKQQKNKKKPKADESTTLPVTTLLENNTNESIASLENLRMMLGPFVLRRLKRDVLHQLVDKEEKVLRIQMSESQKALYGDIIRRHMLRRAQVTAKSSSNVMDLTDDVESVLRTISTSEANNIFTALRKAANHPLLLRVHFSNETVIDLISSICQTTGHFGDQCDLKRIKNEIKEMSDFDINSICLEYPGLLGHLQLPASVLYESPKMKKLEGLLPKLIDEGHRILIFSQWTKMLDIIGAFMEDIGLKFLRLDGSTPVRERQNLIDKFERDKSIPIFILSTKAGGLGINLTAADTVIIYDLDFNPENDRQAEDRCHRIGQTKTVTVYKLVTEDTVEEIIYETGQRKQRLTKAVLSDYSAANGDGNQQDGEIKENESTMNGSEINKMLQAALQNFMKK